MQSRQPKRMTKATRAWHLSASAPLLYNMRYFVLASDYDGTLAKDGRVAEDTLAALTMVKESGRKLVLVTGRELAEITSQTSRALG